MKRSGIILLLLAGMVSCELQNIDQSQTENDIFIEESIYIRSNNYLEFESVQAYEKFLAGIDNESRIEFKEKVNSFDTYKTMEKSFQ